MSFSPRFNLGPSKMNGKVMMNVALLICMLSMLGFKANAISDYDYSASIECLAVPQKPQYNGGIIVNPEFNDGLKGWTAFGDAKVEHRESLGNKYVVAHHRSQLNDSVSQKLHLKKGMLYTFSAWLQVSEEAAPVVAVFKTRRGVKHAGAIVAESKCWSMLKGGITMAESGPVDLYFESKNSSVEILVDSISLEPFTEQQWRSHQHKSVEKTRKKKVLIQAIDERGNPLPNATISIQQKTSRFPFGCAMTKDIISKREYQNWFTSKRFTVTTFANEMKWYSTECSQGKEDYSAADAMLQFAKQHNIAVRGHNILWDDPKYQPQWVYSLSPAQLRSAVEKRINSVVSRYKGQLIAWDVMNENLHFSFFESKLGTTASSLAFERAHQIDPATTLFINEYNTIEESRDSSSTPAKYLKKLREIQSFPGNRGIKIGIGLESHFTTPDLAYIRTSIDTLAATGSPIWLTEVDVSDQPQQAHYLEQILREAHSHPKVQGIIVWSGPKPEGCYRMCLADDYYKNLPTGDVVDKLLQEWGAVALEGSTDTSGHFEATLFHGDYEVRITHPTLKTSTLTQSLKLFPTNDNGKTRLLLQVAV